MELERVRFWRRGFEARSESNCAVVGVGEMSLIVRCRVARAVVCKPRCSQDQILVPVERWRYRNLGKWQRAKKSDTSTYRKLIDSILLHRTCSPSGVNEERMEVKRVVFLLWRWMDRIVSRATRSRSASRRGPSKGVFEPRMVRYPFNTRSTGAVPERLYRRDHCFKVLPQKLQSSGV